jgi:spectrin beta
MFNITPFIKDPFEIAFLFQLLWERFKEFARDTETIGSERVAAVNGIADQLIDAGHSDSATIAEWKDGLNEAWQDLLELIETRTQVRFQTPSRSQ